MKKNWKTSLFGVVAAIAMLFGRAADQGKSAPPAADIVAAVGIALAGLAASDSKEEK